MSNSTNPRNDLAALERLIEGYGADRTRWPAPSRLKFATLIAENPQARRLLAEAAALDRLLDMAPRTSVERERALADRIVTSAIAESRSRVPTADHAGNVTPFAAARERRQRLPGAGLRAPAPVWRAAALLAASLVLGIFAGSAGFVGNAVQELGGVAAEADSFDTRVAFGEGDGFDEEVL